MPHSLKKRLKSGLFPSFFDRLALPRNSGRLRCSLLLADAHAIRSQTHLTMISRATFDIERASFASSAIGIKGVLIWLLIVSIPRKLAARTKAIDTAARLHAFTSRRTVGVERTCHSRRGGKHEQPCRKYIIRADFHDRHSSRLLW